MPQSDLLERLRAANPVRFDEVALIAPDVALLRRITSAGGARTGPAIGRTGNGRRAPRRLVPVLVVTGLLGGAAAYGLLRATASRSLRPSPVTSGLTSRPAPRSWPSARAARSSRAPRFGGGGPSAAEATCLRWSSAS